MALATPNFPSGNLAVLRLGGIAGECLSFSKVAYDKPPNYENASNFCGTVGSGTGAPTANPTTSVGLTLSTLKMSGLIDDGNPINKSPYTFVEGGTFVIFLGPTTTTGILCSFKYVGRTLTLEKQKFNNQELTFVQEGAEVLYPV